MDATDKLAQNTYIEAVVVESKAAVCSAHVPGFEAEFGRRFAAWRAANQAALVRGKELMDQQAQAEVPSVQSFASAHAQVLASLPADDRQRQCEELLALYSEAKRL